MLNIKDKEPELRDEVKHKNNDMTGVVISKYPIGEAIMLDVRGYNDKIYYGTPAKLWEVVRLNDE